MKIAFFLAATVTLADAALRGLDLPPRELQICVSVPGYTFTPKVDQPYYDIMPRALQSTWNDPVALAALCNAEQTCAGFLSLGFLKNNINQSQWRPRADYGNCDGVYVKGVTPGTGYLGCFKDSPARDLTRYLSSGAGVSTAKCISDCRGLGYTYAGLQNSNQCFCGNRYGSLGQASNCNMACMTGPGTCGGSFANSVYNIKGVSNPPTPEPEAPSSFLGCFKDGPVRDLTRYLSSGAGVSTAKCISDCKGLGYTYAGLQNSNQCFCGNRYGSLGEASNCNMACMTGPGTCGGSFANSVYNVNGGTSLSPNPPLPSGTGWEGPYDTPVIAGSAASLPDGKVLIWSSGKANNFGGGEGKTMTAIFDPATGRSTALEMKNTNHDMFCPGTATLADGRMMISGGSTSDAVTMYDPRSNQWSVGPKMLIPRGYHSMATLGDGSICTIGGSYSGARGGKFAEVWSPATGRWTLRSGIDVTQLFTQDIQGIFRQDNHYWLYTAPNGELFHAGPSKQMHWINLAGAGSVRPSILRARDDDAMNGNPVMYDVGKILALGGSPYYASGNGRSTSVVIDINGAEATAVSSGSMAFPRVHSNSIVLPSGEVVVIGGQSYSILFSDTGSALAAEIWNPSNGRFSTLKAMKVPRNYHSVATLMKDGRIFAGGGGICGDCNSNHQDAEILTPPYLVDSNGNPAVRPVIVAAPTKLVPNQEIQVSMNTGNPHTFALVRTSIVTHSINLDQRRIPVPVVQSAGNVFTLQLPASSNVLVPGSYFIFAMNAQGVPSVAEYALSG